MADIQIDRRIEVGKGEFLHHIRTDNARLRRAMGHEGRHIKGAHADQPHVGGVPGSIDAGKRQRPRALVMELGFGCNPGLGHQGQGFLKDAALGYGEDQRL